MAKSTRNMAPPPPPVPENVGDLPTGGGVPPLDVEQEKVEGLTEEQKAEAARAGGLPEGHTPGAPVSLPAEGGEVNHSIPVTEGGVAPVDVPPVPGGLVDAAGDDVDETLVSGQEWWDRSAAYRAGYVTSQTGVAQAVPVDADDEYKHYYGKGHKDAAEGKPYSEDMESEADYVTRVAQEEADGLSLEDRLCRLEKALGFRSPSKEAVRDPDKYHNVDRFKRPHQDFSDGE